MMTRVLGCILLFVAGLATGLGLCWYVSPVWSYNESIGIRETLVDASVSQYRSGRLSEAAVLMQQANNVARRPDATWPLLFPWHGAVMRITGAFSVVHVSQDYHAPETAYLFRSAGQEDRARPYYESLEARHGRTSVQIDQSAAAFVREASSFQVLEEKK